MSSPKAMLALFANLTDFGLDQHISHVAVTLLIQETAVQLITEAKTLSVL